MLRPLNIGNVMGGIIHAFQPRVQVDKSTHNWIASIYYHLGPHGELKKDEKQKCVDIVLFHDIVPVIASTD